MDLFAAEGRVPGAVDVIDLEVPLLFVFELVDYGLEVAAPLAMGGEELDELVGGLVLLDVLLELLGADHAGVGHVPLLGTAEGEQAQQEGVGEYH